MAPHLGRLQEKAAMHAMHQKADVLMEPLLERARSVSSDESSQYSEATASSVVSVEVKQTAMEMLKTAAICLVLGLGVVASAGSMLVEPVVAVFIMGGLCVGNVPYTLYKEYRIIKIPALRNLNNKIREDAIHLEAEVDVLEKEIDELQPEAERAASIEQELQGIAARQNVNAEKLVALVKENVLLVSEMQDNLRQRIMQDVLRIVIGSDKDNDGMFSEVETKMLVLKITLHLQGYGVEFDEEKFYKVMRVDPSVHQTLEIVKRLMPPPNEDRDDSGKEGDEGEEDEEDEETSDMYDMFHMVTDSSLCPGSGVRHSLDGEPLKGERRLSLAGNAPSTRLSLAGKASRRLSPLAQHSRAPEGSLPRRKRTPKLSDPAKTPSSGRKRDVLKPAHERLSGRKRDVLKAHFPNWKGKKRAGK